jgi:hypothetical protein
MLYPRSCRAVRGTSEVLAMATGEMSFRETDKASCGIPSRRDGILNLGETLTYIDPSGHPRSRVSHFCNIERFLFWVFGIAGWNKEEAEVSQGFEMDQSSTFPYYAIMWGRQS